MKATKRTYTFGLVEDQEMQSRFVKGSLQTLFPGSQVLVASTVAEGTELVAKNKLDILILDVHLGKEHCQDLLIKFPAEKRGFPVIIMTADKTEETLNLMFKLGVSDIVTKPLDPYHFEAKLRSLLTGQYISPLYFFGKDTGIGKADLSFNLEIIEATEQFFKLKSNIVIGVGTQIQLDLHGMVIPAKVTDNERVPEQDYFICHCTVLSDLMDAKQKAFLRGNLLRMT
ncbi:MAG: hypothetical protein A2X86_13120 [Bdellovibrionales bacterium GWA2_49_15]|nr:MAG: hypothetical protein A2X86_13120 [Bdellovibrionales bacterium GWA2_49_15]HAZ13464.1 hypothetical protein [Bdellovibrionales bacterium]